MRLHRGGAIGASLLAVAMFAAACSSGGGSTSTNTTTGSSSTAAKAAVAEQLNLGGPPECATRVTCLIGLQTVYGLHFKSFKQLDEVGPISVAALATNQVQVVRLDSSDPAILQNHWVILQDDKSFQQAGNIVPVIRTTKATDEVKSLLNKVSSTMTQDDLLMLDTEVQVNHKDPADVAKAYVQTKNLITAPTAGAKESITVGSVTFSENQTLADIYADVLKGAGYNVKLQPAVSNREILMSAVFSNSIDLVPEYLGNFLSFLDKSIGSLPVSDSVSKLQALLTPKGFTVLQPSDATDSDAIVVTKATADKFHLTKISDLGSPA